MPRRIRILACSFALGVGMLLLGATAAHATPQSGAHVSGQPGGGYSPAPSPSGGCYHCHSPSPPLAEHNLAGWYEYGPAPGQRGPAVILGHVDSATGISVFYHVRNMHAGDRVYVTLADGKVAAFAVDGLQRVAKDAFPTASVYGTAGYPSLRLITCGGPFDRAAGHYVDNIIVYAHLVRS